MVTIYQLEVNSGRTKLSCRIWYRPSCFSCLGQDSDDYSMNLDTIGYPSLTKSSKITWDELAVFRLVSFRARFCLGLYDPYHWRVGYPMWSGELHASLNSTTGTMDEWCISTGDIWWPSFSNCGILWIHSEVTPADTQWVVGYSSPNIPSGKLT
jgi:hypothetical protein